MQRLDRLDWWLLAGGAAVMAAVCALAVCFSARPVAPPQPAPARSLALAAEIAAFHLARPHVERLVRRPPEHGSSMAVFERAETRLVERAGQLGAVSMGCCHLDWEPGRPAHTYEAMLCLVDGDWALLDLRVDGRPADFAAR